MIKTMGKQANILSWFFIIALIFLTAICVLVAFIIINIAGNISVFDEDPVAQNAVEQSRLTILSFDNMMLFVVMGLSLFVIISAAVVYQHPAFFIIGFVLLIVAITFSAIVSNAFWTFWQQETIASAITNFPKIRFLMEKLPMYLLFMGMAATVAGFMSYRREVG